MCDIYGGDGTAVSALAEATGVTLLDRIPIDAQLGESGEDGVPRSDGPAAAAIGRLCASLRALVERDDDM